MRRYVILGDLHLPWVHAKALTLVLRICDKIYKHDTLAEIILNGDIADFFFCNSHGSDPSLGIHVRDERISIHRTLKEISVRYPASKKVYVIGNHETRLDRFFKSKAPELYGIMNLNEFLGLEQFGYEEIADNPAQAYRIPSTDIVTRHEGISNGVNATRLTIQKAVSSVIFSHTHRVAESNVNTLGGKELTGLNIGCLCDFKNPKAPFQYIKGHHQWQLGFCVVTVRDDGVWYYDLVHIRDVNGKVSCMFDGHVWEQG